MKQTIYAKRRTSKDGKTFYTYFTTLKKSDGSEVTVQVKFKEECGSPNGANCPMNIEFEKTEANYREKVEKYTDGTTGEEKETTRRVLWVQNWREGEPFVDTSMDDFI